jgi:hypothetical protein
MLTGPKRYAHADVASFSMMNFIQRHLAFLIHYEFLRTSLCSGSVHDEFDKMSLNYEFDICWA